MVNKNLKNKTALVTGATGAIGGAITKKLLSLGANLIVTGTNKKKVDNLQKELPKNCLGIVADLSKDDDIDNLYNQ